MSAAAAVKALTCPSCGAAVEIRAAGYTVSFVCGHCGTTLDATDPGLKPIADAQAALKKPEIALGTRAALRGAEWEAIGYVERTDDETPWAEYLLFNPYLGYRFLVDAGSRWTLGTLLDRGPERRVNDRLWLGGKSYDLASDEEYRARVTFVVGEFYWRVKVGETVRITEFERADAMLSSEANDSERTWTKLDILKPGEAEAAFGIPPRDPDEDDDDPSGPLGRSPYAGRLWSWGAIALFAIGFLILGTLGAQPRQRVLATNLSVTLDAPEKTVVIGQLTVERTEPVTISGGADNLDNDWVDIDYSLVNRKTQESYDAYATFERYHGTDSDGPWQEGNPGAAVKMSSVPPGDYDLVADISAHRWQPSGGGSLWDSTTPPGVDLPLAVWVDRGGGFSGNFWTALLLILSWPAMLWLLHSNYEKRRKLLYYS